MDELKTFTNIDSEDFEGMYGGSPIIVKAGESKPFTETIAKHLAGQLAYKIAVRGGDGKNPLDQNVMDRLALTMVSKLTLPVETPKVVVEEKVETKEPEFEDLKPKKKVGSKKKK